ncbi:hypothetical protein PIB30_090455 [Stylosanthes scabra]|uniref:Uncharacterized protein n=1 Tax=Stylosanthes scabra TaxID=79078 RepID=A0ABU6ZSZ7_9FABA|nr:hypothetical protein [Stylosanthes scabra]
MCVRTCHAEAAHQGARQPINKVRPSVSTPAAPDPIIISSDSEEDLDPKGSSSEEEHPEMDPEGEDQGANSSDESGEVPEYISGAEPIEEEEEVPEYILGEGLAADQDLEDEEPEEENPEMDPGQDMEDEEMEEEAEQDPNDDEDFADYFELAPPASPDSSDESLPPTDD